MPTHMIKNLYFFHSINCKLYALLVGKQPFSNTAFCFLPLGGYQANELLYSSDLSYTPVSDLSYTKIVTFFQLCCHNSRVGQGNKMKFTSHMQKVMMNLLKLTEWKYIIYNRRYC